MFQVPDDEIESIRREILNIQIAIRRINHELGHVEGYLKLLTSIVLLLLAMQLKVTFLF